MTNRTRRETNIAPSKQVRCAIYTRKSKDEGLERDFNSLDAQRECAEAYITSQRQEGWVALPEHYDDGGYSGANLDRPALQKMLAHARMGLIDCVVVYKIDRLTRALLDFYRIIEELKERRVTFVAVTQQFNTNTSVGRMTLNLLMTFAQFERELISERTRDKMSAARRKGKWTGGNLVLGYDLSAKGGALVVNREEAQRVRTIFAWYLDLGGLIAVLREIERHGWTMKSWTTREGEPVGGARFTKTTLYNLLTNIIYTGRVKYGDEIHPGEHERIVDDENWNRVQEHLNRNGRRGGPNMRNRCGALLGGLVRCASCNVKMTHSYTQKKNGVLYRYYVCNNAHQRGWNVCKTRSVSAPALEAAVIQKVRRFAAQPEVLSETLRELKESSTEPNAFGRCLDPGDVQQALLEFHTLWSHLNTSERERFIRALVTRVTYDGPTQAITLVFRSEGIKNLFETCVPGQNP